MTNTNNDIHELEELLTELEGQEARLVTPYSEDDDAVTTLIEAPLNDQEWMVQVTALDRRMMGTEQVVAEWRAGKINGKTLIWRTGMNDWTPIGSVSELRNARELVAGPEVQAPAPVQRSSYAPPPPAALPLPPPVARPASVTSTLPSSPAAAPPPSWTANPAPAPTWSASPTPAPSWTASAAPAAAAPVPPAVAAPVAAPAARVPTLPSAVAPVPGPAPRPNAGNVTLPGKMVPVKPITAPPTAVAVPDFVPSQTNSTRPVEVDYPEPSSRGGSKKVFIGLGAVAVAAVVVTLMALSGGDDEQAKASPEPSKPAAAQPQAVMGLNPTPAAEKKEAAPVTADPAPAAEPVAKAEEPSSASESSAAAMVSPARSSKASTRYVSRESGSSASRRNSKDDQDDEPAAEPAVAKSEAAAEPPAAAAPAAPQDEPAGADAEDGVVSQEPEDSKLATPGGKRFDKEAAATVLNDAADKAKNCRPKGGPTGKGRVRIRYEPNGKVSSVSVLTSKFENTVAGSCVTMLFRRASVPAFNGGAVVVNKSFDIP
jgi:hypothetical protein